MKSISDGPLQPGQLPVQPHEDLGRQARTPGSGPARGSTTAITLLAPLLVGHAEHRDVGHRGMHDQLRLDLGRVAFTPPEMIMSALRSQRNRNPSSSR